MEARDATVARRLEQRLRPEHVREQEAGRVEHREAVVRLGGEVHDDVDGLALEHGGNEIEVADVALDEGDAVVDVGQVVAIARVREEVERDDAVARMLASPSGGRNSSR